MKFIQIASSMPRQQCSIFEDTLDFSAPNSRLESHTLLILYHSLRSKKRREVYHKENLLGMREGEGRAGALE